MKWEALVGEKRRVGGGMRMMVVAPGQPGGEELASAPSLRLPVDWEGVMREEWLGGPVVERPEELNPLQTAGTFWEELQRVNRVVGHIPPVAVLALLFRETEESKERLAMRDIWSPQQKGVVALPERITAVELAAYSKAAKIITPIDRKTTYDKIEEFAVLAHVANQVYEREPGKCVQMGLMKAYYRGMKPQTEQPLPPVEILHSHKGGFRIPVHAVTIDRQRKEIVVAVRVSSSCSSSSR